MTALREYLNGNYYGLQDAFAEIKSPLLATLSFLELDDLSLSYSRKTPQSACRVDGSQLEEAHSACCRNT